MTGPFRFAAPESREDSADLLFLPDATAADWAKVFAHAEPVRVGAGLAIVQAGEADRPDVGQRLERRRAGQAVEERELADDGGRLDRLEWAVAARQPHAQRALGDQVEPAVLLARLQHGEPGAHAQGLGVLEHLRPVRRRRLGQEHQVRGILAGLRRGEPERADHVSRAR